VKAALIACTAVTGWQETPPEPGSAASPTPFHFVEIASKAGLYRPVWCGRPEKPHLLESGGSGLALFDCDQDGDLDLYLVQGWKLSGATVVEKGRNALYRNRGDGTFEDVTEHSGAGDDSWGCGVAVGDVDGDGDLDLFASNFGPDRLYLNRGDGTFTTAPDPPGIDGWSTGATLFDADGDGDLDLYVTAYVDSTLEEVLGAEPTLDWKERKVMKGPFGLPGLQNCYFQNLGGGCFREATKEAGLEDRGSYYSFTAIAVDLDVDLDLDLYVANDSNPNYLYRNDGTGHFEEIGLWSGAALDLTGAAQAGMGVAVGDIDDNLLPDIFVTNFAEDASTLYRNLGNCLFVDDTRRLGLRELTYAPLSWGTLLEDFDLDGDLDLFIANGHIYPQADAAPKSGTSYRQANLLLAREESRFVDESGNAGPGLKVVESSRGAAAGDFDGDGDLDLAVSNVDATPTLLRNDTIARGSWLLVDAPGALRVLLESGGRQRMRAATYGGSYVSASDMRFHFGLGPVTSIERVTVVWPRGEQTVLEGVRPNRVLRVRRLEASGRETDR
jgi:hypothetical protein